MIIRKSRSEYEISLRIVIKICEKRRKENKMRRSQIYLVLILFIVGYFLMEGKFKKRFTSEEKEEYELISQKYFKNLKIYRDEWGVPRNSD